MQTTRDFISSSQSFDPKLSLTRPCHVLLETLTSDYEARGSSLVQSRQDEVFDGPGEANSDSGDSLFITQKSVPEAVRTRRCSRLRSDSQNEDSAKQVAETTSFSSASDEEIKTTRKRKKKIYKVPNIRFSFLTKTSKTKPIITKAKHMKLQMYTMGGFISSVHELWKSFELGGDLAESLSTVDADGKNIRPISEEEEEEETLEEEDLKVVERKHFLTLKAKSLQPWNLFSNRSIKRRRRIGALNGSQKENPGAVHKDSTKRHLIEMSSSSTESSDDGDALGRGMGTIRSSSPQEVSTGNIHTQTERADTKSQLPKIQERLLSDDSDTIMRNQEAQTAPLQLKIEDLCMDEQSQSESTVCGFENQNTPQRDDNGDTLSSESKVEKRKKKNKSVEEGSQEPDGQCDVVSSGCVFLTEEEITLINEQDTPVSNRKKKKKKKKSAQEEKEDEKLEQSDQELEVDPVSSSKTGSDSKEKKNDVGVACVKTSTAAEPSTDDGNIKKKKKKKRLNSDVSQTPTKHQEYLENTEVSQESVKSNSTKRKKKKKDKKKKSADEEVVVQQEQSDKEVAEDSVSTSKTGTGGKKKKKKRNDVGVACVKTNTAAEPPTDDGNIKKKKKKKCLNSDVSQTSTEHQEHLENTEVSPESLESKFTKKKKKKEKRLISDVSQTSTEHQEYLENTEVSQESVEYKFPKKKKKKSAFDSQIGEGDHVDLDFSNDAATLETNADLTVKKKKKKKKRGISETEDTSHYAEENKNIDDTQKEAHDAEPKAKKKKMRGNTSKIIQENLLAPVKYSVSSPLLTADEEGKKGQTHEKHPPDVSIDALAATSADASGSLGESKDRKKKKKTSTAGPEYLERELEFKELKETSKNVVKKKKKHKRNDSELMSSTERSESLADAEGSQTDEAVVLRKKKKKKKKDAQKNRETLGHHVSLPSSNPGNQTPKEKKRKTKGNTNNKHLLKVKSPTKTVSSKKRAEPAADSSFNSAPSDKFLSEPETSSIRQKNKTKNKRRLYNPSLDLFSDC